MTTKHTPAPWSVDTNTNDLREAETIRGGDGVRIAATYKIHEHRDDKTKAYYEARANSRLIAAAPELLEALKNAIEIIEGTGLDASIQRAAITKATGEQP
jgi:hypothetical protein